MNTNVGTFRMNALNQITNVSRPTSPLMLVAGTTTSPATNVAVWGTGLSYGAAARFADNTWAREGASPVDGTNSYTAIAQDVYGRASTNSVSVYLPVSSAFGYDLNGNMLSDGQRGFDYDDENQLIRVLVTNAWKSEFVYDGKMRRRLRIECSWAGSTWVTNEIVQYVYDGNLVLQERHYTNLQVPAAVPQVVTYTRGLDLSGTLQGAGGIGGLLARSEPSTLNSQPSTAYYHADGNGNITCMVNGSGAVVAKYIYDPYGNVISLAGPLAEANLYRFSSKEWHAKSGLVYYLYRYYEPNLQRWLNRDPIGELGFEVLRGHRNKLQGEGPNLYAFVRNNPVAAVDGYGLKIYKCARQGMSMTANMHVYLWDDKQKLSCGRTGGIYGVGEDAEGDKGPGTPGHKCIEITGSEGKEATVMSCCRQVRFSIFFPFLNDCHNWADRCLKKHGLDDPRMNRFTDEYWEMVSKGYMNQDYSMN